MLNINAIYKTSHYKETFRMKKERRKKRLTLQNYCFRHFSLKYNFEKTEATFANSISNNLTSFLVYSVFTYKTIKLKEAIHN